MSNPNNAFGTNAAFGGRTSPNAFNDVMGAFQTRGILSGWACSPDSGMSVVFGGDGTTRDVAIAEDNSGNKLSVNNIPGTPISVTIAAAPATQTRIDAVIAYIENPPQGAATATDNYGAVNVLDVQGTASSSPVAPDDNAIRTAITADGASGSTAYYVVLAYITVASGTTDITSNLITAGPSAELQTTLTNIPADTITTAMIQSAAVTSNKIDWTTLGVLGDYKLQEMETPFKDWNGDTIYRRIVDCGALPNAAFKYVPLATVGVIKRILKLSGIAYSPSLVTYLNLPMANPNANLAVSLAVSPYDGSLSLAIGTGSDRSGFTQTYVEVLYTKN